MTWFAGPLLLPSNAASTTPVLAIDLHSLCPFPSPQCTIPRAMISHLEEPALLPKYTISPAFLSLIVKLSVSVADPV